jgi:hypothetical protein
VAAFLADLAHAGRSPHHALGFSVPGMMARHSEASAGAPVPVPDFRPDDRTPRKPSSSGSRRGR